MQVNQSLSILFYRKTKKLNKKGLLPLYCRLTIDGIDDEISTSCYIRFDDWDPENKTVKPTCINHKAINKKLGQMKTDLERHFDLVVAKNGLAIPKEVFKSYKTPINGHKEREDRVETSTFSIDLDELVKELVKHLRKIESLEHKGPIPAFELERLEGEKKAMIEKSEKLAERGRKMWDDKQRIKTLVTTIDEHLFNFVELVLTGQRARTTFSKIITAKSRIIEFVNVRYKKDDMRLSSLEISFIEDFTKHIIKYHKNSHNTVWKYVQILKEFVERAFTKGWMSTNVFATYTWSYKEPDDKDWPTMEQMLDLIAFQFEPKDQELSEIRWVAVFQGFSGQSYAELRKLNPDHLIKGIDNATWIDQRRQKTEVPETLPLLPICLDILEMFKNDPRCLLKRKCLPVPTDQHYNRCLKIIGEKTGITCLNNSHQWRYFFSNVVLRKQGVDLDTIGIILGQKDRRSVRTYVKPEMEIISDNMKMVKRKLFEHNGPLNKPNQETEEGAKVISMNSNFRNTN
jgi:integrase